MLRTIARADAPVENAYAVTLEAGQKLELTNTGAAVVNEDGSMAVVAGDAWVKGASGVDVPTHYSVDGSTLIQTIDHTSVENVAYPRRRSDLAGAVRSEVPGWHRALWPADRSDRLSRHPLVHPRRLRPRSRCLCFRKMRSSKNDES